MAGRAAPAPRSASPRSRSFIAGSVATLVVALFSPPLAEIALKFQPADYFSLMVFGLVGAVVLARGSLRKAIAMVVLGLLLGLSAPTSIPAACASPSASRRWPKASASSRWPWACSASPRSSTTSSSAPQERAGVHLRHRPRAADAAPTCGTCVWSIARGTGLGSMLGILPGGGALLASFAAYTIEKKVAREPQDISATATSAAWPRRRRPTTPARRPRSSRC